MVSKNGSEEGNDARLKSSIDFLKGVLSLEVADTKRIGFGDDVSASLERLSITVSLELEWHAQIARGCESL